MEALIQIRRGTAAQWISANPILGSGEPGIETDTRKGKFGDGVTHWNTLGYSWQLLSTGPTGPAGGSLTGQYPNPTLALNTVGAPQIADGSVGTAELANLAVTSPKIADLNVVTAKIADLNVTNGKLAADAVTTDKILDGTIAVTDLAPAAVSALKVDVYDEGAVSLADADRINFTGAGVAVTAGGGVATVTITGAPATAIVAGTISEWADPTPPAGWYLCDGTVKADMAGTLGTKYGLSPGTLPFFYPRAVDGHTTLNSDVITGTQPGWATNAVVAHRQDGMCTVYVQWTRTGAQIDLGGPNHGDQTITNFKAPWIPDFSLGGIGTNEVRHTVLYSSGQVVLSAGIGNISGATIGRDEVMTFTYHFPAPNIQTIPRTYKIIKAP